MEKIKSKLTYKENEIYNYIKSFKQINGYSPTWNEIAKGCYTSKSYVKIVLEHLSDKGYISYSPKKCRSIVVTKFEQ